MLDIHIAKVNGISIIDLVKEKMIVKLKDKQSFFRQSFWKKKVGIDNRYELPITKNGSKAGKWAKNFSIVF